MAKAQRNVSAAECPERQTRFEQLMASVADNIMNMKVLPPGGLRVEGVAWTTRAMNIQIESICPRPVVVSWSPEMRGDAWHLRDTGRMKLSIGNSRVMLEPKDGFEIAKVAARVVEQAREIDAEEKAEAARLRKAAEAKKRAQQVSALMSNDHCNGVPGLWEAVRYEVDDEGIQLRIVDTTEEVVREVLATLTRLAQEKKWAEEAKEAEED